MRIAALLSLTLVLLVCARLTLKAQEPAAEAGSAVASAVSEIPPTAESVDFNRDIRPILSNKCFTCHGPDDNSREADLRFDLPEVAYQEAASGLIPIVPGDTTESELVRRILTDDEFEQMPPASSKKPLTDRERELLVAWVEQGAQYDPHWAFVPPVAAPLPQVAQPAWCANAIDYFVLARLEAEGLSPSPQADRYTLIRRVYLDLVGLLPEPAEVEAFVNDPRPDAYERLVDRLLASPRYGERWARPWLDLARYADTNGYEKDRPRTIWPYRDWVIEALNDDMPFDEFTIDQIAGDMLPAATAEQIIATGFHRNTMINEEGGIDPKEFRFVAQADRVNTTGTVWLGLTVGCSQCHTHKYDPLSQSEYYRLMAFYDQADDVEYEIPDAVITARRQELETEIAALEEQITARFAAEPAMATSLEIWAAEQSPAAVNWSVLRPTEMESNQPRLSVLEDHSILALGDEAKTERLVITADCDLPQITAIRVEALPHELLPAGGPGRAVISGPIERPGRFNLSEFQVLVGGEPVAISSSTQSYVHGDNTAEKSLDGDFQSGWSNDGAIGQRVVAVFHLAQPLAVDPNQPLSFVIHCEAFYSSGLGHFRLSATDLPGQAPASGLPFEVEAALAQPVEARTAEQQAALAHYWLHNVSAETAPERQRINDLRGAMPHYQTTYVMQQRPKEFWRTTHRHHRGEFATLREEVLPGVQEVLHDLPENATPDRLALAKWLVDDENPLVARVAVNRDWAAIFGRGIVHTTEDFGMQGESPSHAELLDWLAVEFMRQGWSRKELHRLIVTSSTYRQSSSVPAELLASDPDNILLARGPRLRLDVELIRDTALEASGLLSDKMLGPSVFPPQPAGVTDQSYGVMAWNVSGGEDRYRRGLYTFMKRTTPYAMFGVFDAPSGELCVARRPESNTPLQALTMLNDEVLIESAQAMARRALASETQDARTTIELMFRWCLVRPPEEQEIVALIGFYDQQLARLNAGELEAGTLAGPPLNDNLNINQQAALALVARVLLNLDEMVSKN